MRSLLVVVVFCCFTKRWRNLSDTIQRTFTDTWRKYYYLETRTKIVRHDFALNSRTSNLIVLNFPTNTQRNIKLSNKIMCSLPFQCMDVLKLYNHLNEELSSCAFMSIELMTRDNYNNTKWYLNLCWSWQYIKLIRANPVLPTLAHILQCKRDSCRRKKLI